MRQIKEDLWVVFKTLQQTPSSRDGSRVKLLPIFTSDSKVEAEKVFAVYGKKFPYVLKHRDVNYDIYSSAQEFLDTQKEVRAAELLGTMNEHDRDCIKVFFYQQFLKDMS